MSVIEASPRSWGRRVLATAALTTAAGLALAAPAEAAVYYSLHAGIDYSSANARSTNREWVQCWAIHGNVTAVSGWYNLSCYAFADSGWSTRYAAGVRWVA